jgi:hypothetical protein
MFRRVLSAVSKEWRGVCKAACCNDWKAAFTIAPLGNFRKSRQS